MTLSVQATFTTETSAKSPTQIGLRGLLAGKSLAELLPYKGPGYDHISLGTDSNSGSLAAPEMAKPKKTYPVESYYLNGAQYLTGGVGNRLSFH